MTYVATSPALRAAASSAAAAVSQIKRAVAGSFCTVESLEAVARHADELERAAANLRRAVPARAPFNDPAPAARRSK